MRIANSRLLFWKNGRVWLARVGSDDAETCGVFNRPAQGRLDFAHRKAGALRGHQTALTRPLSGLLYDGFAFLMTQQVRRGLTPLTIADA